MFEATILLLLSGMLTITEKRCDDSRVDQSFSGFTNTSSSTLNTNLALEQRAVTHLRRKVVFRVRLR